jgi:hypothetical protein
MLKKYAHIFFAVLSALLVAGALATTSVDSTKTGISSGATGDITPTTVTTGTLTATTTTLNNGTVTTSIPVLNMSQLWNNAATTFTGLLVDVTKTAGASTSTIANFRMDGTSALRVYENSIVIGKRAAPTVEGSAALPTLVLGGTDRQVQVSPGNGNEFAVMSGGLKSQRDTGSNHVSMTNGNASTVYGGIMGVSAGTIEMNNGTPGTLATLRVANSVVASAAATAASAPTIASASTIAPTKPITFISGTTPIGTITVPSPISAGGGQITLIPTGIFVVGNSGNVALTTTAVVSKALIYTYDVTTNKWYPSY